MDRVAEDLAKKLPDGGATITDWLTQPDERGAELIGGVLVYQAMPHPRHGRIGGKLFTQLDPYDRDPGEEGPGGWWLSQETDLKLGADGVRPDLCGWRRERCPDLPEPDPTVGAVVVRPDWVCEVLSPSTADRDLGDKADIYYREQVDHYWIIDPSNQVLTVLRWTKEGYVKALSAGKSKIIHAEPFGQVALDLRRIFRAETGRGG